MVVEPDALRLSLLELTEVPLADARAMYPTSLSFCASVAFGSIPRPPATSPGSIGRNIPVRMGSSPVMRVARVEVHECWE